MKVHAQKAIACILLISLVASVTNTLFSNLILLQSGDRTDQISKGTPISKTGISTTKSADIFSVLAQEEGGGDEEVPDEGDSKDDDSKDDDSKDDDSKDDDSKDDDSKDDEVKMMKR